MKRMTLQSVAALFAVLLIAFSSCKKEESIKPPGSVAPADKYVLQPLE